VTYNINGKEGGDGRDIFGVFKILGSSQTAAEHPDASIGAFE